MHGIESSHPYLDKKKKTEQKFQFFMEKIYFFETISFFPRFFWTKIKNLKIKILEFSKNLVFLVLGEKRNYEIFEKSKFSIFLEFSKIKILKIVRIPPQGSGSSGILQIYWSIAAARILRILVESSSRIEEPSLCSDTIKYYPEPRRRRFFVISTLNQSEGASIEGSARN